MLVSGGVDSSVCAALLRVALDPSQVVAVHIDNGFMRHNESAQVEQSLRAVGINVIVRDCFQSFFMGSTTVRKPDSLFNSETPLLCYTINPEEKRKIIGDTFVRVSNEIIRELRLDPNNVVLAQGTLRPDLIESASKTVSKSADTIKTHHNDTELVRALRDAGKVVEPLQDFHKDEVRAIGFELGLPTQLVQRHPFPGPGLAIRILCAEEAFIEKDFAETQVIVRVIVDYHNKAEKNHALLTRVQSATNDAEKVELLRISQSMQIGATILPVRSVGVQGDARTYSYVVALSTDRAVPNWADMMFLAKLIPRILHNINRVCYVFGPHVVHQVTDVTPTRLSKCTISQLREADHVANQVRVVWCSEKWIVVDCVGFCGVLFAGSGAVRLLPAHIADAGRSYTGAFRSGSGASAAVRLPLRGTATVPVQRLYDRRADCARHRASAAAGESILFNFHFQRRNLTSVHLRAQLQALDHMVTEIQKIDGISRVLYDLTAKPPGTTEWE